MRECEAIRPGDRERAILVGDLNVAPLENDVWSHKQMLRIVSHTPIECEKLLAAQKTGNWIDSMRVHTPEPAKLYTLELSFARLANRRQGAPPQPCLEFAGARGSRAENRHRAQLSRRRKAVRSCAGDGDTGTVTTPAGARNPVDRTYILSWCHRR